MNKLVIFFFLFTCLMLSWQCSEKNKKRKHKNEYQVISLDFKKIINNEKKAKISDIAEKVEYIKLEWKNDSKIGNILDAKLTNEYIFIHHSAFGLLAQFDRKGNFIRNIGKQGRGPKEYSLIRNFSIDEEKGLIFIQGNWVKKTLVFTFDGKYLRSIKNTSLEFHSNTWVHDSTFLEFMEPLFGDEKFVFVEKTEFGDTIQGVKNHFFWEEYKKDKYIMSFHNRNIFYRLNSKLHFKGWYNDTIYTYDTKNRITPKYFVNLGNHKLDDELRIEKTGRNKIPENTYWFEFWESERYIFLPYGSYSLKQGKKGFAYFDKKTKEAMSLKENNGEISFINDFDGGPRFKLRFVKDSLAYSFIEAFEIMEHMNSGQFYNSTPLQTEFKNKFVKKMKDITENDNPVLMIIKLKK
jgi:hypothetical protein